MAQQAAENVQWSNRKPGLFILLLSLQLFLPCRLWWWVVYINSSHLLFFQSLLRYLLLARLWVHIIANLVSGLMGGWRLWGADTGRADTDWHWPAKNWRSKIQENLNPRLIQSGLKFCWKDKSYFPSPSLTRIPVAIFLFLCKTLRTVQFREMVMTFSFVLWQKEVLTVSTVFRLSVGINGI